MKHANDHILWSDFSHLILAKRPRSDGRTSQQLFNKLSFINRMLRKIILLLHRHTHDTLVVSPHPGLAHTLWYTAVNNQIHVAVIVAQGHSS